MRAVPSCSEVRTVKRPDLLILIAIWMFISTLGAVIGIIAIAVFAFPHTWDTGGIFGLSIAEATLACYVGLSVAGGIGLLRGKGWGRILAIVNAILSLFAVPIGTVIGALVLVYLFKPEVKAYFEGSR